MSDAGDLRVQCDEQSLALLRKQVEQATRESYDALLRAPLERLREAVARLHEVTGKADREVVNKKTGAAEVKPPIFRDSVIDNLIEEISLLRDFATVMPDHVMTLANEATEVLIHPQQLRDDPDKRRATHVQASALLDAIDSMLED